MKRSSTPRDDAHDDVQSAKRAKQESDPWYQGKIEIGRLTGCAEECSNAMLYAQADMDDGLVIDVYPDNKSARPRGEGCLMTMRHLSWMCPKAAKTPLCDAGNASEYCATSGWKICVYDTLLDDVSKVPVPPKGLYDDLMSLLRHHHEERKENTRCDGTCDGFPTPPFLIPIVSSVMQSIAKTLGGEYTPSSITRAFREIKQEHEENELSSAMTEALVDGGDVPSLVSSDEDALKTFHDLKKRIDPGDVPDEIWSSRLEEYTVVHFDDRCSNKPWFAIDGSGAARWLTGAYRLRVPDLNTIQFINDQWPQVTISVQSNGARWDEDAPMKRSLRIATEGTPRFCDKQGSIDAILPGSIYEPAMSGADEIADAMALAHKGECGRFSGSYVARDFVNRILLAIQELAGGEIKCATPWCQW